MFSISPMDPQITLLEHAFNFSLPDVPNETVSCLSKLTFDGEGNTSAKDHLNKFWCKCIKYDISDLGVLCRLFAFTFRGRIKQWFESFPACHIFYWFQFVDEFLNAFEIYDFDQLCEEFHTSLINGNPSSEHFLTRVYHILCKFNLDDMSLALNLFYDASIPSIQSCSITNKELIANPITQLQEQSSSQEEENSSNNVEQAREVESIDHALIDNQIGFSFESLYFQSSNSMEYDLFLDQGEYPHSCNSCSNQHLKSVIEEHLSNENLLECSSTPMNLIREEVTQLEEETLNLHPPNALCSQERLDACHINFELSVTHPDDHIMIRNSSPNQSKGFKESKENCLENNIVDYHSSRDSFYLLISDSFYSLYPDLFLDYGGLDILPTTYYFFPPQSYPFNMLNFGEVNSEHNIDKTKFDACSLSSLTWEEDMLRDDFTQFMVEKDNALCFMEIKNSKFHIRSLISSNLNVDASHFEMINLIEGNIQTNDLIDCMDPPMMSFPLIYSFHQSHGWHLHFSDRILGCLEYSYMKKFHNKDKVELAFFLPKYLGSRNDMFLLDPPCEEVNEHIKNCQEDRAFQPWLMVFPILHNPDKFFKTTYTRPCHYDPYHDNIAQWLEDSYNKNIRGNGKIMLTLFLDDDYEGKCDMFLSFVDILPFFLIMLDLVFIAGLELLRWLHWKHDFT
jgi:hypothetical protein